MRRLTQLAREHGVILLAVSLIPLFHLAPFRSDGPFLPADTNWHYAVAALFGLMYLGGISLLFRPGDPPVPMLAGIAALTGTAGIALLLGFQKVSEWLLSSEIQNDHWLIIVVKVIGYANVAVQFPDVLPFPVLVVAYTIGVGLCEEACKVSFIGEAIGWRSACKRGLACGVGFGVCEGILYSMRFYNGTAGIETYVLRFVSVVAFHAALSGLAAISVESTAFGLWDNPRDFVTVLIVPASIHGAYDAYLAVGDQSGARLCATLATACLLMRIGHLRFSEKLARSKPGFHVTW
jgi:RsiW-degrading membrane proteinase PrsW (M82 family)